MIHFVGQHFFKGLNIFTFQNPPKLLHCSDTAKQKNTDQFLADNFHVAEIFLSLSQLLQWYQYVFLKDSYKNLHQPHVLKKESHSTVVQYDFGQKTRIKMVQKKGKPDEKYILLNEYYIGVYCTNPMRCEIPHFAFHYFCDIDKNVAIYQEYIKGTVYASYLKNYNDLRGNDFLSIFLQILLALEYSQNFCLFSHNDLHQENIILRKNHKDVKIQLYGYDYVFPTPTLVPTLIDFGYSIACFQKNSILSNVNLFPQYGYFPFFISGTDIVKFIIASYQCFGGKKNFKNPGARQILTFLEFLMTQFLKINMREYEKDISYITNFYFNFSPFPIIYCTPMELFDFILKNANKVCQLLQIQNLPVNIHYSFHNRTPESNVLMEFKSIFSFDCLSTVCPRKKNLLDFTKSNTVGKITIPNIFHIPLLNFQNEQIVKQFLNQYGNFIPYYETSYQSVFIEKTSNDQNFKLYLIQYTKFYRILKTLEFYLFYLKHLEKDVQNMKKIHAAYVKRLSKLFYPL